MEEQKQEQKQEQEQSQEKKGITVKELVDHILKHMTAEEALTKLLATQVEVYDEQAAKMKVYSPYFMIVQGAKELGWDIMVETEEKSEVIRGLSIGTEEYLKDNIKEG